MAGESDANEKHPTEIAKCESKEERCMEEESVHAQLMGLIYCLKPRQMISKQSVETSNCEQKFRCKKQGNQVRNAGYLCFR